MPSIFLQIILMTSLGIMVYLIARAVPRINDIEKIDNGYYSKIDNFISFLKVEKIDVFFSVILEKVLRKLKFYLMKWDNILTSHIKKIKKENGDNEKQLFK